MITLRGVRRVGSGLFLTSVFAFLLTPLIYTMLGSLNDTTLAFPPSSIGLRSYAELPPEFFHALYVSLVVASASTCLAIPFGICGALGIVRGRFPGRNFINALLLSPLSLPMLVLGASLYRFFFLVDQTIGISLSGSLLGLILGHTSFCIPYVTRGVIPVLTQMSPSVEEAA